MIRFFTVTFCFLLLTVLLYWIGGYLLPYLVPHGENNPIREEIYKIHSPAKDFSLPYWNKNKSLSLKTLKGKPIFLHFWATWCFPCIEEFPEIIQIAERYKNSDLQFVAISLDQNKQDIQRFFMRYPKLQKAKEYFHILIDTKSKIAYQYNAHRHVPKTFLIDRNFILQYQLAGAQPWTSPQFKTYYDKLFQEILPSSAERPKSKKSQN